MLTKARALLAAPTNATRLGRGPAQSLHRHPAAPPLADNGCASAPAAGGGEGAADGLAYGRRAIRA